MTRNMNSLAPTSPFAPVGVLFMEAADSDLRDVMELAHAMIEGCPTLLECVEADLDAHGLAKKAARLADKKWEARNDLTIPGIDESETYHGSADVLLQGRKRTQGYVVLMTMLLRGFIGAGFKSQETMSLMQESKTLATVFSNLGMEMPRPSTLTELVNAMSSDTHERVLDAQVAMIGRLKLDDFKTLIGDSTHIRGNTEWPTDSRLLVDLGFRIARLGKSIERFGLPALEVSRTGRQLDKMKRLDREIALGPGGSDRARTRRRRYGKLLAAARRVHDLVTGQMIAISTANEELDILPSKKAFADRAVERLKADLIAFETVIVNCEARVLRDEKVKMDKKVLSVSDPDAAYIAKGQRDPVIGYKPQLGRSGSGFVTSIRVPRGNAADSNQLVPMVDDHARRTGVAPEIVSVDDGYSSKANVAALKQRNIEVISISGSKGRKLTSEEDWASQPYIDARNIRSAVESLIYTLKNGFNFGYVARRGLPNVVPELIEKVLAYNFCHMVRTLKRRAAQLEPAPVT